MTQQYTAERSLIFVAVTAGYCGSVSLASRTHRIDVTHASGSFQLFPIAPMPASIIQSLGDKRESRESDCCPEKFLFHAFYYPEDESLPEPARYEERNRYYYCLVIFVILKRRGALFFYLPQVPSSTPRHKEKCTVHGGSRST